MRFRYLGWLLVKGNIFLWGLTDMLPTVGVALRFEIMSPLIPPRSDRATYERGDPGRGAAGKTAGSQGGLGPGARRRICSSLWSGLTSFPVLS